MDREFSTKENNKLQLYILYFFIFAFAGWLMETIYSFIVLGHFTMRGFLYGPICPIYGYGALILIIFLGKYKNNFIKLFTYAAIVCSVFEYYTSYILEVLFHSYWWDYRNDFLNLNGRISIFYTVAWGIIAIVFIGFIYPFIDKKMNNIISKISYSKLKIFNIIALVLMVADTILSSIKYLI